jgi:hypothetical protein
MSYTSMSRSSTDPALTSRITAAVVQEAWNNPANADNVYADNVRRSAMNAVVMHWPVVIATDIAAAYESAVVAGNPNPGGDPAVVTDGMILANVQAKFPQDDPAP